MHPPKNMSNTARASKTISQIGFWGLNFSFMSLIFLQLFRVIFDTCGQQMRRKKNEKKEKKRNNNKNLKEEIKHTVWAVLSGV